MSKYQEAYLGIEQFIEVCIGDLYDYENSQIRRDMETIVELVKKATPMKIETEIIDITEFGKNEVTEIVRTICPNCSEFLFVNGIKHCYYCGQALDWNR
mgnify:CR=1 FL=1